MRYYQPMLGAFTRRDPLEVNSWTNRYAYALGNPTNLIDPEGLLTWQSVFGTLLTGFGLVLINDGAIMLGITASAIGFVLLLDDIVSGYDPTSKVAQRLVRRRVAEAYVARYGSYEEAVRQNAAPPVYELLKQGWTVEELIEFGIIKCIEQ
jgi:uncharacterized protein RhaS with RHS repeats